MSATRSLTNFYGSFFLGCAEVAVSPYSLTLNAFMGSQPKTEDLILGIGACVFFSTIVPILPEVTSFTFAVAAFAASLALASMFVTYPISILMDALNPDESSSLAFSH
ncbi:MAG: hypothetical protein P4L79_09515 [Legionella sp.]|uniref:hypothetical protein n=1 Tax=Legionella sp. TaxID=459 RepID=UPI0028518EBF|nr:hypothetical protein [Legionella sp.]